MRPASVLCVLTLALALPVAGARAQTTFPSIEPNDTKAQATPAFGMRAGDSLFVFGYSQSSPNIFRVRHASAPPGIYRHELQGALFPPFLYTAYVLGRDAVLDSVFAQSNAVLQDTGTFQPGPFLTWYGFGKSEELFVDLRAGSQKRQPGILNSLLVTTPVVPTDLGVVAGPSLWFRAESIGGAHDLELHLFDAEHNALPRGHLDQSIYHPTDPSLEFDVAPGVYFIAVADHPAASHLPAGPDDLRQTTRVLDFAGAFINGSEVTPVAVEVSVRSGQSGPVLASASATKTLPYEVLWFRVEVGAGQASASFCPGDGSGGTCACFGASPPGSGMGCVNSTGRGATVIATDHSALPGLRPWRITLEDLPPTTLALAFLTLQTNVATPILAGLNCIGPGAVRVGPWQADPAGTVSASGYLPSSNGFLVGQTVFMQAAYRDFFAPVGCQLNFTSGFSFVVR